MIALARRLLLLAALTALAGCSGLLGGGGPPPQLYTLTAVPAADFASNLPRSTIQLLVEVPVASGALDTERIALMRTTTTIDYFANAAWTDRAPIMVQGLLVESFENTGKIGAIGREGVALRADYVLKPELRDFTAVYTSGSDIPTIRVRMGLKLVRMSDRQIVDQRSVEAEERAQQNTVPAVVDAFNAALHRAIRDAVAGTLPALSHS